MMEFFKRMWPREKKLTGQDFDQQAEDLRLVRGGLSQAVVKFDRAINDFDVLHKDALRILDEGRRR